MDKKSYSITEKEPVSFRSNKIDVLVQPYITPVNQSLFIHSYVEDLFKDEKFADNYLVAEWSLMLAILDKMTDIPVTETENNVDLSAVIGSGLWEEIKDHIYNYVDFRNDLNMVVENIKWQKSLESAVGTVVKNLSDKAFLFLDKMSNMDLSETGIKTLVSELQKNTKEFETKFMNKEEKPKRKRTVKETE